MRNHGTVEQVQQSSSELRLQGEVWKTLAGDYGFSTETFIDDSMVVVVVYGESGFDLVIEITPQGITAHREYENGEETNVSLAWLETNLCAMRSMKRQGINA